MELTTCKNQDVRKRVYEAIEKAKRLQPILNAVVSFAQDIEEQLAHLEQIDTSAPLYGIPVVLKDNVNTKGLLTSASSRILSNYIPVYDACIVEKLKAAGAIIIAKSSMDELGMGGTNLSAYTGPVHNPYDTSRISGGSSGGSAVLTAADVTPLAIGTDTGDSVRKPAAYNGVVGMKPTYGRISRYGIIPYASSLDHVGYFTTSVADAALALHVLAGRDDRDMTSSTKEVPAYEQLLNSDIKGKRIAIIDNVQKAIKDESIRTGFDQLMMRLKQRGAIVESITLNEQLLAVILPTYYIIANAEATANHSNLDGIRFGVREDGNSVEDVMSHSRTAGFSANIRKRFVVGSYSLFVENQDKLFRKAQKVRRLLVEELARVLDQYDITIASAAGSIAPHPQDSVDEQLSDTYLIAENHMILGNFSGYPSISVPCGFVEGMPVGVNLMAKPFAEQTLFDIALAIEEESGLRGQVAEVTK
ncbi:MAG: Asp-tRNA(Asn)/Glu-tRNA(Gln) amidotransferase subunit GatA [Erysipelotrichaceae bacterium]|nr:Asp-tRNA(Asn)/Glu-tRNA(Gln) amidotransferase subunit GatA [Erysipelotrichaceae bacterium]